jgi:hypothetical protein
MLDRASGTRRAMAIPHPPLEAWPADKRAQILLAVIDGAKRFEAAATEH